MRSQYVLRIASIHLRRAALPYLPLLRNSCSSLKVLTDLILPKPNSNPSSCESDSLPARPPSSAALRCADRPTSRRPSAATTAPHQPMGRPTASKAPAQRGRPHAAFSIITRSLTSKAFIPYHVRSRPEDFSRQAPPCRWEWLESNGQSQEAEEKEGELRGWGLSGVVVRVHGLPERRQRKP